MSDGTERGQLQRQWPVMEVSCEGVQRKRMLMPCMVYFKKEILIDVGHGAGCTLWKQRARKRIHGGWTTLKNTFKQREKKYIQYIDPFSRIYFAMYKYT